jgi:lipopolysaccharide transport system ATP-binding protein
MGDLAIRVENLSKRYRIGQRERYLALRDVLARALTAPFRIFSSNSKPDSRNPRSDYIWALKDVSFEVKQGEVVGIIGRNGAGKTTLLKILARITRPTSGYAEVRGRVGSLLEVGTGFHPELTGRENVYLSGAVLGMTKREIDRKFDEIVDFAGVAEFIDTPLKTTARACRCAWPLRWRPTWSRRSSWWTKSWPWETWSSRRNAWAKWKTSPEAAGPSCS